MAQQEPLFPELAPPQLSLAKPSGLFQDPDQVIEEEPQEDLDDEQDDDFGEDLGETKAIVAPEVAEVPQIAPTPPVTRLDRLSELAYNIDPDTEQDERLRAEHVEFQKGAITFYIIAALSIISCSLQSMGISITEGYGLGITDWVNTLGSHKETSIMIVAALTDLCCAGLFVILGSYTNKGKSWPLMAGAGFLVLDTIICLFTGKFYGVFIHLGIIWHLFRTWRDH